MKKKLIITSVIVSLLLLIPQLVKGAELDSGDYAVTDTYISRINPETTVETFKTNLNATSMKIYKDSTKAQEVTNGNVGTDMCTEYEGKNRTLSVIGDLNNDGKANQLDLSLMIRHILGFKDSQITQEMKKLSADITGDNNINNVDITALIRYNIFGEFYITVSAPEITSMTTSTTTDSVKITVSANNAENGIYQYSYKEEGESSYTEATKTKETSYTITGLKANTKYTVQVRVTNKYGMADKEEKEVTTVKNADTVAPTIREVTSSSTTNSVTLGITATDDDSGITGNYTFYIKETSEADSEYKQIQSSKQTTATGTNLKQNTSYTVKVEVSDAEGNKGTYTKEITTKPMPSITNPDGSKAITQKGNTIWSNEKASIEFETSTGYTIQYQVNGTTGEWKTGEKVENLNNGDKVYVRLWDGTNGTSEIEFIIEDKIPPTITEMICGATTNSIAIQVTATDNESGIPTTPNYVFYIKETAKDDSTYEKVKEGADSSLTKTGLTQGTRYTVKVEITDNAGNKGTTTEEIATESIDGATTGLTSGTITATTPVWTDGKATITLSTTTNQTIEWQINNVTGEWTQGTTVTNLNHNDTVYARLTDGTNVGQEGSVAIKDTTVPENATINFTSTTIAPGQDLDAEVMLLDNQSGVDVASCKWVYNTDATAQIDESTYTGTFTTEKETLKLNVTSAGTYYLHILTVDKAGNKTQNVSTAVEVKQLITGITLDKTSTDLANGKKLTLTATITPENADNKELNWTSSSPSVATVTDGVVTGLTLGTTTITAEAKDGSGIKATCVVTVREPTILDIEVGEWVKYTGGGFTSWRVLYEANNPDINNGTSLQILSAYSTENITIGSQVIEGDGSYMVLDEQNDTYQYVIDEYNNYIPTLNAAAQKYINTSNGAVSARSLGTVPTAPDTKPTEIFTGEEYSDLDWLMDMTVPFIGIFGDGCRDNCVLDAQQITNAKMTLVSTVNDSSWGMHYCNVWCGGQDVGPVTSSEGIIRFNAYLSGLSQMISGIDENGFALDREGGYYSTSRYSDTDFASASYQGRGHFFTRGGTRGFIPVITLSDTLELTGGNGTKANPWVLE